MDEKLKTPYWQVVDFSITRELGHNFSLEASYVGRFGRRLLQETDRAMPMNVSDAKSGMDYFTPATMLSKMAYAGTPTRRCSADSVLGKSVPGSGWLN